jgi:hypothetical protein
MKLFKEFFDSENQEDIKSRIVDVLDSNLNPKSDDVLSRKLEEFKNSKKLVTDEVIGKMIDNSKNRAAILELIKDGTGTIAQLINLISDEENI